MSIYRMKIAEVDPDARYEKTAFMASDPAVRFWHFHLIEGDGTIGNVHLITFSPERDLWQWSMTVSLPGSFFAGPRSRTEPGRGPVARQMIKAYRRYLATRPETTRGGPEKRAPGGRGGRSS